MKKIAAFIFFLIPLTIVLVIVISGILFNSKKLIINEIPSSITPTPTISTTPTFTPTPSPEPTLIPTSIPQTTTTKSLDYLFTLYGSRYGVDSQVLKKIAGCESGFDVNQITGDYAGLFQFGSTPWIEARGRLGENNDLNLRFNAEESIKTAAHEIQIKGTSGWGDCD